MQDKLQILAKELNDIKLALSLNHKVVLLSDTNKERRLNDSHEQTHAHANNDVRRIENNGDVIPVLAKLPRGGWLKNPFDELNFKGKTNKQNPIRFLQIFEKLAFYEKVPEDQLYYFGRCFKGAASQRFKLQIAENIREIKTLFRQYFWGCQAQMRF